MNKYILVAPCHFGLESVLKREIYDLGYEIIKVEDGRVTFEGDEEAICRSNIFLRTTERSNLYMESIMFQYVFVRLLTTSHPNDPFSNNIPLHIAKLKRILDTRYYENHTLDSLQEELKISKYRLCREFSIYYETSPLKYLNKVRIDKAKEFLLETDETIVSIGSEV